MNTEFLSKPLKKHGRVIAWRGGTTLAIATLVVQAWMQHDENKNLSSRNTALWASVKESKQEIEDLRAEVSYLEGRLNIPHAKKENK